MILCVLSNRFWLCLFHLLQFCAYLRPDYCFCLLNCTSLLHKSSIVPWLVNNIYNQRSVWLNKGVLIIYGAGRGFSGSHLFCPGILKILAFTYWWLIAGFFPHLMPYFHILYQLERIQQGFIKFILTHSIEETHWCWTHNTLYEFQQA